MLEDVLSAASRANVGLLYLLTSDRSFDDLAARYSATLIPDAAPGYNSAVAAALGMASVVEVGAAIVLPGDVPAVRAADVRALALRLQQADVVLAASNDGGTAALGLRPPGVMQPAFGRASAAAHRRLADRSGLRLAEVSRQRLAVDVDTVADLAAVAPLAGRATAAVLRQIRASMPAYLA